jgi:hypothetical protein
MENSKIEENYSIKYWLRNSHDPLGLSLPVGNLVHPLSSCLHLIYYASTDHCSLEGAHRQTCRPH